MNSIEYALKTAIYYYGYEEILREWAKLEPESGKCLFEPYLNCDTYGKAQLDLLWCMFVVMFGEWGTSPRSGWIVDLSGFRTFLKENTEALR